MCVKFIVKPSEPENIGFIGVLGEVCWFANFLRAIRKCCLGQYNHVPRVNYPRFEMVRRLDFSEVWVFGHFTEGFVKRIKWRGNKVNVEKLSEFCPNKPYKCKRCWDSQDLESNKLASMCEVWRDYEPNMPSHEKDAMPSWLGSRSKVFGPRLSGLQAIIIGKKTPLMFWGL